MTACYGLSHLQREIDARLSAGVSAQLSGVSDAVVQVLSVHLLRHMNNVVVIVPKAKDFSKWTSFLEYSLPADARGAILPPLTAWGADRYINPTMVRKQRLFALHALQSEAPCVCLTTLAGLLQLTLPVDAYRGQCISVAAGNEYDMDLLCEKMEGVGYLPRTAVEEEGSFAIRGGIVDVFPFNANHPARLEFIGDRLDSLREFALDSQISQRALTDLIIGPASEAPTPPAKRAQDSQKLYDLLLEQAIDQRDRDGLVKAFQSGARPSGFDMFSPLFREARATAVDFARDRGVFLFAQSVEASLAALEDFQSELQAACRKDSQAGRPVLAPERHFDFDQAQHLREWQHVECGNPHAAGSDGFIRLETRTSIPGAPAPALGPEKLFSQWVDLMRGVVKTDGRVLILVHQPEQMDRVKELLALREIPAESDHNGWQNFLAELSLSAPVSISYGDLAGHLWLEDHKTLIVPEHMIVGASRRKKPARSKLQNYLSSFRDLKVGDLVVHVQHGIGRYRGMQSLEMMGVNGDFLILEYAQGDKVYLPVDRLNLLQRYASGGDGAATTVDKLGGQQWEKRKSGARKAVRDLADQLLKLQAQRALAEPLRYNAPDDTYLKFESTFPYEETEDQARAIADVESDLRQTKPMDRLVCGDVGFGKTEIALRAAMRAVLEGYQVLVLVPTTVLCYQHYRTFTQRVDDFGVSVAQVNRFVKPLDQRQATEALQRGQLDILVGTHRLLSKDIRPKRLGLVIIDEEQRFGVEHKEKLKELKAGADVLTMTATPIPRTLHMSMVGLKDISIIATPPQDRLSVRTYIAQFDESLIKEAITHEVGRGGQVFFIHNRVEDIEEVRMFVKSLVPHLEVRAAHGQMRERQLETQIVDFIEQRYPVLVCTTIIESGVDMPNVNTLIVNRADRFGLAQLYQLRGRVGRSNVQAYAYFLTPPEERLTDDARERLDVIATHQELGAGFQIASHDLEIRGAGNLLGGEQSGQAAAVGLELYTEMLEQAIAELRGQEIRPKVDTEIKIPVAAVIPASYLASENQRLHLYKRVFGAMDDEELMQLRKEVRDRFGALPTELERLFKVAALKQKLRDCGAVRLLFSTKGFFELHFGELQSEQVARLIELANTLPEKYRLAPGNRLHLLTNASPQPSHQEQDELLVELTKAVAALALDP